MSLWTADSGALLEGLTPAQAQAVTSDGAPLCILAGAGSGKTRVLTRRIAWRVAEGSADAPRVLALTFTRRAAGELRSRLRALGVRDEVVAGTFHAAAHAALLRRSSDANELAPTLLTRKAGVLARLSEEARHDASVQPVHLAAEIEWAAARMIRPEGYEAAAGDAGRRPPIPPAAMASLYERYEIEKRRRRLVDFDDLLRLCVEALEVDPAFAARERWRIRHLFVDEFQDVNPLQTRLLDGWRGDRLDLCVVGDPDQSIYAWNGADPGQLAGFARRHPTASVLALDDNFRSTPQVLAVASAVLGAGGRRARLLTAHRPDGRLPSVNGHDDDRAEAAAVARGVRDRCRPGMRWSQVAVLTRTHAQLALVERALQAVDVPSRVLGRKPFLERPEVLAALDDLRRVPRLLELGVADLEAAARGDDAPEQVDDTTAAVRASLAELGRLGREFLALDPGGRAGDFVAWLTSTMRRESGAPAGDGVELATFHAAKGLEWRVVFLAGLERGFVPVAGADDEDALAEERRLLYVAVTRAEDELHCSWARQRSFGNGRTLPRQPSPWLADVEAAVATLAAGTTAGDEWRARLAEQRRRLSASPRRDGQRTAGAPVVGADADPQLLAALKQWRSGAARAAGVPAFVILHDTTLAAVAEARPRSRTSLLDLPGVGPVKADRYGDDLLRVVSEQLAS